MTMYECFKTLMARFGSANVHPHEATGTIEVRDRKGKIAVRLSDPHAFYLAEHPDVTVSDIVARNLPSDWPR